MSDIVVSEAGFWREVDVVSGAALALITSNSQLFGGYFFQNPGFLGDAIEFSIDLTPGDYKMSFFGARTATSGIQSVFFDGDLVGTFDHYFGGGGTQFNTVGEANVTVVNSTSVVRAEITGQNAGSVGYVALVSRVFFSRV